ncbi:MAG: sugar transferase [Clostridia bacterium]|nr:sugar transferase [Clostridia bacterium]
MSVLQNKATAEAPEAAGVILPFEKKDEYFIEHLYEIPSKPVYRFFKRVFDILLSVLALILLAIPMLVIAIIIKCTSRGTVFYHQDRLGLNGRPIRVTKFRTMHMDAEVDGAQWSKGDEDGRIYPFGLCLRKMRLDELPQFWGILKGDLSLVGPRPERECFYKEFETYIHGFKERLKVKPGLTGLAQINGGYDLPPEEKILWDVKYIKNRSLWNDFKIMCKTVAVVFTHDGAK